MEWLAKLYNTLKIPLKIVLPAVWLFSGALTLLDDKYLMQLNLLEWKNENGFVFGLIFLITSCLIVVYAVYFIKEKFSDLYVQLTRNRRTMKKLGKMDDVRFSIICRLYNSAGHTATLNYSEPLVQALLAEGYIYAGGEQLVSVDPRNNVIYTKFTLQPFVWWALDYYKPKLQKHMDKLEQKANTEKDPAKRTHLKNELSNMRENYNRFYNGGL